MKCCRRKSEGSLCFTIPPLKSIWIIRKNSRRLRFLKRQEGEMWRQHSLRRVFRRQRGSLEDAPDLQHFILPSYRFADQAEMPPKKRSSQNINLEMLQPSAITPRVQERWRHGTTAGGLAAVLCRAFYILCQWGRFENKESALRFFVFFSDWAFFLLMTRVRLTTFTSVYQKWCNTQETGRGPYVQVHIFNKCSISPSHSSQLSHTTGHRTRGQTISICGIGD